MIYIDFSEMPRGCRNYQEYILRIQDGLIRDIEEAYPELEIKSCLLYTSYLDVLVDGEFEVEKKELDLHWKGSANQMVINVPETLGKGEIVLHEENC